MKVRIAPDADVHVKYHQNAAFDTNSFALLTSVLPLIIPCYTPVIPLFHACSTPVISLFHPCYTPVMYPCSTPALPKFYPCHTPVIPLSQTALHYPLLFYP